MKKSILGVITLLLISISSMAHHIDTLGRCGGSTYFRTGGIFNSVLIQIRLYNTDTVLFEWVTPAEGSTDTTFSIEQPDPLTPIRIQFRYRLLSSPDFTAWEKNDYDTGYIESAVNPLPGCSTLAVGFTNFTASKTGGTVNLSFTNEDESGISQYQVLMSADSKNWTEVKSIVPDGSHTYSVSIGYTFAFLLPFLIGFKINRMKKIIALLILGSVIFWSCKKDNIANTNTYKYSQIIAINKDGSIFNSNVIVIK